ncbi:hypothetical protein Tco_1430173 [Tanacetum coccineum]
MECESSTRSRTRNQQRRFEPINPSARHTIFIMKPREGGRTDIIKERRGMEKVEERREERLTEGREEGEKEGVGERREEEIVEKDDIGLEL